MSNKWKRVSIYISGALFLVAGIIFFCLALQEKENPKFLFPSVLFATLGFALPICYEMIRKYKNDLRTKHNYYKATSTSSEAARPSLNYDKKISLSCSPQIDFYLNSIDLRFQIYQQSNFSKIYSKKDIVGFEIKVDNEVAIDSKTKTSKGVGKALAGGLLFGGVGLVAGAIAGGNKSTTTGIQKEVHHYTLVLRINDILKPSYVIELRSLEIAEEIAATLAIMTGIIEQSTDNLDKFEQLKMYKELLDSGIITQEEFDSKKKELL